MGFVVGLTGGIGSGKTAVSDRFAALGVTIADADVAAREVVVPGSAALAKIREHFGEGVVNQDGALNRAALREIVFRDPVKRKVLESITVPAIMTLLRRTLSESQTAYAMLMLSSGGGRSPLTHRNLVVDVSPEIQLERVTARDNSTPGQVRAIMAAQPPREARLEYAHDVIVNEGRLDELDEQVLKLHRIYLQLAQEHDQSENG